MRWDTILLGGGVRAATMEVVSGYGPQIQAQVDLRGTAHVLDAFDRVIAPGGAGIAATGTVTGSRVRGHPRAFQNVQWWRSSAVRVGTMWSGARDSTV